MGILSSLFGKKPDTREEAGLVAEEKAVAEEEKAKADALKRKQQEQRMALKARSTSLQGGGRKGLMFGGSAKGVA